MSDRLQAKITGSLQTTIQEPEPMEVSIQEEPLEVSQVNQPLNALMTTQPLKAVIFLPPQASDAHGLGEHTDTNFPANPEERPDGYVVTWDGEEGVYVLAPPPGGPGDLSFLDLTDTPDAYAGQGGKFVAVKADETGVEFVPEPVGEQGPQGDPGPQGEPGADGDSAYEIAVANGFIGTEAEWLESLEGEQGPQGIQGEQGIQGIQGPPGADGIDGEDGDSAYEIAVAEGFVGTIEEWLESLIGPEGPQGIQGPQGDPGATGPQGDPGPTGATGLQGEDGLSAYEVAVDNGFVGTEEEWLETLVGPQGIQGETGAQGPQGETGATGPRGGFGGYSVRFNFDSSTVNADPGNGDLRLNHATPTSASQIFVDDLDAAGGNAEGWIGTLGLQGRGRLFKENDSSQWIAFFVNATVEETGYWRIGINSVTGPGTFSNGDSVILTFSQIGPQGATGATGSTGSTGATGATGATGGSGGNAMEFVYSSTTTMADPGSGFVRFNNATPSNATSLVIDDVNAIGGTGMESWLSIALGNTNSVRAFLHFWKKSDPNTYVVVAVTDSDYMTGYTQMTIVGYATNGTFTNGDAIMVSYAPWGDRGDTGATGSPGGETFPFTFSTTTTDSDPGSGTLRYNHATFASITQIFIDSQDSSGNSLQSWIDSFDLSTNPVKGSLIIRADSDPGDLNIFLVTAVAEATGYWKLTVTPVIQLHTMTNGLAVNVSFVRSGDAGVSPTVMTSGTWTPIDASGAGLSFSSVSGRWRRWGDMVYVDWSFTYPTTASPNAAAFTASGGFPFNAAQAGTSGGSGIMITVNAGTDVVRTFISTSENINLFDAQNNGVTNAEMSGKVCRGWIIFITPDP